jgi:hypothetical protein
MIGAPRLTIEGTGYNLDWGHRAVTVSAGEVSVKIDNARLAHMLGSMPLHEVVRREIARGE